MTQKEMKKQIEELMLANAKLQADLIATQPKPKGLTLKVSPKGAISVYGMGKWPTTLYASQWETIFTSQDTIKAFILANTAALASKAGA